MSIRVTAGLFTLFTVLFLGFVTLAMSVYRIGPGYAGVVYNVDGGIEDTTLSQGWHIVSPWKKVTEYPVSTETVYYSKAETPSDIDDSLNISTSDGKQVNASLTYTYHMDIESLPVVFSKFRGQPIDRIEDGMMRNELLRVVNETTSQYSLMDLVGNKRPEVNKRIYNEFNAALKPYGIIIETLNLSDVVPDEQTAAAVQAVVNAQNELERSKIEKERAIVEAEKKREIAKGEADAAIIRAEGQSEANAKLQQTLTPIIIEQQRIEKWDGKLPTYSGSDMNLLIQP